jgi:hypothetical protein
MWHCALFFRQKRRDVALRVVLSPFGRRTDGVGVNR